MATPVVCSTSSYRLQDIGRGIADMTTSEKEHQRREQREENDHQEAVGDQISQRRHVSFSYGS